MTPHRYLLALFIFIGHILFSQESSVPVHITCKDFNGKMLQGEEIWIQEIESKKLYKAFTDENGVFDLEIIGPGTYMIMIKSVGDAKNYSQFAVPKLGPNERYGTYNIDVEIEPTKVFTLDHVYFELASAELTNESFAELNELVEIMRRKRSIEIEIGGHTDQRGSDEYNMKLSQDRANSVKKYLVSKGIESNRIKAIGYGESQPIYPIGDKDENVGKNRRTEVKILKD